ncbi:hypothetical protein Dda_2116 [Drechslerella dactyloides]|uniref:Uncharacterized protein n=1 Tax=Drechslerella dactyloides TaxID=74499 RepID=A0AAD6J4A9_DREDA|nr:hypothetical protein Dda_2116 [Drechslerella dactyloides]
MAARYTLIHQPQHRTNTHASWERYHCTICNPTPPPTLPYELYTTTATDPFCVQVLASKFSTSRAAVANAYYARIPVHPTRENTSVVDRRLRARGTKARILTDRQRNASADADYETQRRIFARNDPKTRRGLKMMPRTAVNRDCDAVVVAVNKKQKGAKGRNLKGRRVWLDDEMDIDGAKSLNWDHEMNFERDDAREAEFYDSISLTEDEIDRLLCTPVMDAQDDSEPEADLGNALSDEVGAAIAISCGESVGWNANVSLQQDLRALGILYDSADEDADVEPAKQSFDTHTHICEHIEAVLESIPGTPRAVPYTPGSSAADTADMDEVWVIVGERVVRVAPEAPSEWDVVSEYLLT